MLISKNKKPIPTENSKNRGGFYKKKQKSLLVSEEEVRKIFAQYLKNTSYEDKSWKIIEKTNFGGGFSEIYRIENDSGEKRILKVMSAKRTVKDLEVYGCSQIFNAVYNELFAMRLFTSLDDSEIAKEAYASELKGYYEYKTEYDCGDGEMDEDWIFFIIMPEYETLGKFKIKSEKDVRDIALDVLRTLKVLHNENNFVEIYKKFAGEGILSFSENCLIERKLKDYISIRMLLHNDIKPKNILIKRVNGRAVAVLSDYGAVRFIDPETKVDIAEHRFITESYVDPILKARNLEIHDGDLSSDIYSLGMSLISILYISGSLSFRGITRYTEKFNKDVDEAKKEFKKLKKPDYISDRFWTIILGMINPDRWARFSFVEEVIEELEAFAPSEDEFPVEAVAKVAIWNLINENNKTEIVPFIISSYKDNPDKPIFIKLLSFVILSGEEMTSELFEKIKKLLKPLMNSGDFGASFLYILAVILAKEKGIFEEDSEEVKSVRVRLRTLSDLGYAPAVHLFMCQATQSNVYYRIDDTDDDTYITGKFESMLNRGYIPGIRYYKDRLENKPELFYYNDEVREEKLESIDTLLKAEDMDDALAVMKWLLENSDNTL